jgi:enoyl-CoA hydratase/carnithine racemase
MQSTRPAYFSQYRSLKLTRDAQGVLVAEFHSNGFPLICTAQDHAEFIDAFNRNSHDRANQIVILTGTGGAFISGIDFAFFVNVAHPAVWNQVHDDGVPIRLV